MNVQSTQLKVAAQQRLGALLLQALSKDAEAIAFRSQGDVLTRGALSARAQACAARIAAAGLQPGAVVAVEVEHTLELPVAMCAVQFAEACAVPIDPTVSPERRAAILKDIAPEAVLSRDTAAPDGLRLDVRSRIKDAPRDEALAFVVYTSGSSGGPKGVMITHESYTQRMAEILPSVTPRADDVDLAWTPASFTVMVDEMFLPLLAGMPTVIASPALRADPRAFAAMVAREGVTSFRTTPSMLELLLQAKVAPQLSGVRTLICSGEAFPTDVQVKAHEALNATLLGFYGATEAPAVGFIPYDRSKPPREGTFCIPQPFARLRVTRDDGAPADPGEVGEIWIGGIPVALGYFNRPELTAEKFVTKAGARWYRSGDLGRLTREGEVEILGRADMTEVNVNGARVSLPEVMDALRAQPGIEAAFVTPVSQDGRRDPVLVAHCVARDGSAQEAGGLRTALLAHLSSPAVPAAILFHDAFPLTDNGKIDARRLTALAQAHLGARAPRMSEDEATPSGLVAQVVSAAEEILGRRGLTGSDSFFAAGGDSLRAVQLALLLGETLTREIDTALIANSSTLRDLASALETGQTVFAAQKIGTPQTSATPLFTINDRARYELLSRQLPDDIALWNLNMFGLGKAERASIEDAPIEELGQVFAEAILAANPVGPWPLMAFCGSASLAIETGRALRARTGQTSQLILVDAFFTAFKPSLNVHLRRFLDFGPSYYLRRAKRRLGLAPSETDLMDIRFERRARRSPEAQDKARWRARTLNAAARHKITPYAGPVTLIISREMRHNSRAGCKALAGQGLIVEEIGGFHNSAFQPHGGGPEIASVVASLLRLPRGG